MLRPRFGLPDEATSDRLSLAPAADLGGSGGPIVASTARTERVPDPKAMPVVQAAVLPPNHVPAATEASAADPRRTPAALAQDRKSEHHGT